MFSKNEIKRNLLGCLEVFLLMPAARNRFGTSYDEAIRSFIIPILLFPLTLSLVFLLPESGLDGQSQNTIALLYSLRLAFFWVLYLGVVYWITRQVDRREHFWQFVIANNWLSVPASLILVPVLFMINSGAHSWEEMQALMAFLVLYTYGLTAFMATYVLRIPWELAGFIAMVGFIIDDSADQVFHAVSTIL